MRMAELVNDKREKGGRGLLERLSELVGLRGPYLLRGKRQRSNPVFSRIGVALRDKRERMMGKAASLHIYLGSE